MHISERNVFILLKVSQFLSGHGFHADMDSGTWVRYKIGNYERTTYINLPVKGDLIDKS